MFKNYCAEKKHTSIDRQRDNQREHQQHLPSLRDIASPGFQGPVLPGTRSPVEEVSPEGSRAERPMQRSRDTGDIYTFHFPAERCIQRSNTCIKYLLSDIL